MNKLLMVFLMAAGVALAQDGRQIMKEVQKRQHTTSMRYQGTIISCTTPKGCPEKSKYLVTKSWVYERIGDFGSSKAILRFTGPADVKGVTLLVMNHPDRASDQWLWRPAVGREQRVAMQDRSSRFFGTDFSFEDLEERDVDQYDYTVTGEVSGKWRIDAKPKKVSEYTHSYFWIDKTNYTYQQIEAYDKKGLARTIEYGNYEQIQGIWTAHGAAVVDAEKKTRTAMTIDKVEYNIPLKDEDFTVEALRRSK